MAMRLEGLVRLVESFSPYQLQEAALLYLRLRGYRNPELSDGWKDGGTDLRLLRAAGIKSRIVIQLSVEKRWQGKLRSDLHKALENYDVGSFLFISSRRLPELEFGKLRDQMRDDTGVTVERVDSQSLASAFYEAGRTQDVLDIAGIDVVASPGYKRPTSFAAESSFSYLFFSAATRDFRDAVVEQVILAFLAHEESKPYINSVESAATGVVAKLGLAQTYVQQFESVMDRMLQEGELYIEDNSLKLSGPALDHVRTSRTLNELAWQELLEKISGILRDDLGETSTVAAQVLLPYLGAAATQVGRVTGGAFGRQPPDALLQALRPRLAELDARIHEVGIAEPSRRREILQQLISITTESPVGKALIAAEVFILMANLRTSELSKALGGRESSPVLILDSNVAMPVLVNLFYGPATGRFFVTAQRLHRQAQLHSLEMRFPADYLEEAATHLLKAANYASVVDFDEDLRFSTNAYVAHYAHLRSMGKHRDFQKYIRGLGATPDVVSRQFQEARRIIMNNLATLFERYGIAVVYRERPSTAAEKSAEVELIYLSQTLHRLRPQVTERHDARIVAHLQETSRGEADHQILCTWDRLLLSITENVTNNWTPLDPATLVDLLSITSGDPAPAPMLSVVTLAMSLTDEQSGKGAEVLDWLISTEKGALLQDAEYRDLALSFKREYLSKSFGYAKRNPCRGVAILEVQSRPLS